MSASQSSPHRRSALSRSGVALALWGLALLLACAAVVTVSAVLQLRVLASQEAEARAQLVADALGAQVQRAVNLGVPLERLEGVDALFAQRMQASRDIVAVALGRGSGDLLWVSGPGGGRVLPPGPRVESPVRDADAQVATVVLVWRQPDPLATLARWAPPLAAWVIAVAVLAAEALHRSWARGLRRRDLQVLAAAERIEAGDFTWRLPPQPRRDFDPRGGWLSAELRHVNELYLRIHRLVHSLRQTEPEAARRAELDTALAQATGTDRFRLDVAPASLAVQADDASRWRGVLVGAFGWLLPGAALWLSHAGLRGTSWIVACAGVLVAWLALLAWSLGRRREAGRFLGGLATGLALVGPGLVLPWCTAFGLLPGLGAWLVPAQVLVAVAGMVLLVASLRSHRRRPAEPPAIPSPALGMEPVHAA